VNAQVGFLNNALQAAACSECDVSFTFNFSHSGFGSDEGPFLYRAPEIRQNRAGSIVRLLLEQGAYVNAHGGFYGSAIQAAAHGTNLTIIEDLL
jgi:hypothetical protein